jgi:hypothetical protein
MPRPGNSTTPNPLLEKRRGLPGCFPGVASGKLYPPVIIQKAVIIRAKLFLLLL